MKNKTVRNRALRVAAQVFAMLVVFLVSVSVTPAIAADWSVGNIVGLCKGTHIYRGPGESYGYHTIVPENDWAVKLTGGQQGDWWDTSRKAAGDPSGGTGWVKKSEALSCKQSSPPPPSPNPPPPPSTNPASPQLTAGVALSKSQVKPGERIEGSFSVRNNGGQSWQPQRLGIGVSGPSYLDFGWAQNINVSPSGSVTFQGAVPNAPNQLGTYTAYASWQDSGGTWRSLGGNVTFTIVQSSPVPTVAPPLPSPNCTDNAQFVGQSTYPTVQPGQSLQIYFDVRNNGTCTWRQASSYFLGNINGTPLGAASRQELGADVVSGGTKRWTINITAPTTPGTYRTQWMLKHGNTNFGPNMFIDVTVQKPVLTGTINAILVHVDFVDEGVYGLFEVPSGAAVKWVGVALYGNLGILGDARGCGSGQSLDGISARPGFYLVRGCVSHRVAKELDIFFDKQLRDKKNWWLSYGPQ